MEGSNVSDETPPTLEQVGHLCHAAGFVEQLNSGSQLNLALIWLFLAIYVYSALVYLVIWTDCDVALVLAHIISLVLQAIIEA